MDKEIQRQAALLRQHVLADIKRGNPSAKDARNWLHIRFAAAFLGFTYEERIDLDLEERQINPLVAAKPGVIAGLVDMQAQVIAVSESFAPAIRHFTAYHEVGHIVLHSDQLPVQHRDKSIDLQTFRPPMERAADQFAAAYTMPEKWVIGDVEKRFGQLPIKMTETFAWLLDSRATERLLDPQAGDDLLVEHRMATATNVGGEQFDALNDLYGVTAMAMALRLKELGVIDRP